MDIIQMDSQTQQEGFRDPVSEVTGSSSQIFGSTLNIWTQMHNTGAGGGNVTVKVYSGIDKQS